VTSRAKQVWMQRRNDELEEKSNKDSRHFWKVTVYKQIDKLCLSSITRQRRLSVQGLHVILNEPRSALTALQGVSRE